MGDFLDNWITFLDKHNEGLLWQVISPVHRQLPGDNTDTLDKGQKPTFSMVTMGKKYSHIVRAHGLNPGPPERESCAFARRHRARFGIL